MYRAGHLYTQAPIEVYDHDWPSLAVGKAIPHGHYDLSENTGYVQIGISRDTHEFAMDSLRYWWQHHGKPHYGTAGSLLLLCDGGGSNSARSYLFKAALQDLAIELGIDIRVAHYPPYTSKHNPIEHRLFPHLTRATQGVIFDAVNGVKDLMATATTTTGLTVFSTVIDTVYETGKKATDELKASIRIVFDEILPKWNYTALANPPPIDSII
ncbi:MAG: ISAzo13 family transposase [Cyanobacteria bacterium J06560_6]